MKICIAVRQAQASANANKHARHLDKAKGDRHLQKAGPISIGGDSKYQAVKILLLDGIIYTCKLQGICSAHAALSLLFQIQAALPSSTHWIRRWLSSHMGRSILMFMSVIASNELDISGAPCMQIALDILLVNDHTKVVNVHGFEVLVRKEATKVANMEDGLQASEDFKS